VEDAYRTGLSDTPVCECGNDKRITVCYIVPDIMKLEVN